MTFDSIDLALWLLAVLLEGAVLALAIWRRIHHTLPVFTCFMVWCLLSDAGMAIMQRIPNAYLPATIVNITVDAAFQLAILAELGRTVVRNNRITAPSRAILFLLAIPAAAVALVLNRWQFPHTWPAMNLVYVVLLQFLAALRLVFLLTLAWWSSLLKLQWGNRELRIITGLGLYIMTTFLVVVLHTHDLAGELYHRVDQMLVFSYLWALCLWVSASTTKVAEENQ